MRQRRPVRDGSRAREPRGGDAVVGPQTAVPPSAVRELRSLEEVVEDAPDGSTLEHLDEVIGIPDVVIGVDMDVVGEPDDVTGLVTAVAASDRVRHVAHDLLAPVAVALEYGAICDLAVPGHEDVEVIGRDLLDRVEPVPDPRVLERREPGL